MVIDHANKLWFGEDYLGMFLVGRGTFPLFCYALAVAMLRKGPEKGPRYGVLTYGTRLMLFALLSSPITYLAWGVDLANVLFTLAFGAALAGFSWRMKDWQFYLCCITALAACVFHPIVEYGLCGILLPAAMMMEMRGKTRVRPFLFLLIFMMNINGYTSGMIPMEGTLVHLVIFATLSAAGAILIPLFVLDHARKLKQTGRYLPKYALHFFYPLHLIVLILIGKAFAP